MNQLRSLERQIGFFETAWLCVLLWCPAAVLALLFPDGQPTAAFFWVLGTAVPVTALRLIYKRVGSGTELLSTLQPGETLNVLTGLGNGYDLSRAGEAPLLLGGGVGVPPLYLLAKRLREAGKRVTAVLGFNTAEEVFAEEDFRALGCDVTVTTADGSYGRKGFVTDALPAEYSFFYTCGPKPMLRAVYQKTVSDGQFSFEERMGCGFGACMGCSCRVRIPAAEGEPEKTGYKRICREGPVLEKEEILWDD